MAGNTPTIALSAGEYYTHKNKGAMMLFGQENYSLAAESMREDTLDETLLHILENHDSIEQEIKSMSQ